MKHFSALRRFTPAHKLLSRFARLVAVVAAVSVAGCMGSFALTKKLYGFNETVTDNKIINNVIFWGLNIIPIYSLAVTVDVVILNTIEFWTGAKLLGDASDPASADVRVAVVENADGSITVTRNGEMLTLVPQGENAVDVYRDGKKVGTAVRGEDGSVVARDVDGSVVAALDAEDAAAASDVVASVVEAP